MVGFSKVKNYYKLDYLLSNVLKWFYDENRIFPIEASHFKT